MSGRICKVDPISGYTLYDINTTLFYIYPEWQATAPMQTLTNYHREFIVRLDGEKIVVGSTAEGLALQNLVQREKGGYGPFPQIGYSGDNDFMLVREQECDIGKRGDDSSHIVIDTTCTYPGYLRLRHTPNIPATKFGGLAPQPGLCPRLRTTTPVYSRETGQYNAYVKLWPSQGDKDKYAEYIRDVFKNNYTSDSTLPLNMSRRKEFEYVLTGPAINIRQNQIYPNKRMNDRNVDVALAYKCPFWPAEAVGWISRPRQWPESDLVEEIYKEGCHVVAVPHPESQMPEIEWRFSFACAEKKLCLSLNPRQRHCYQVFKMLVSFTCKPYTSLSSYCLKNLFFWTLEEEHDSDSWNDPVDGRATALLKLLNKLLCCLVLQDIPQYFLPENNLLLCKPGSEILEIAKRIWIFRQCPVQVILDFDSKFMTFCSSPNRPASIFFDELVSPVSIRTFSDASSFRQRLYQVLLSEYAKRYNTTEFCRTMGEMKSQQTGFCYFKFCKDNSMDEWYCEANSKTEFYSGMAWCTFVFLINENNFKGDIKDTDVQNIIELFQTGTGFEDGDEEERVIAHTLFGMFLQKIGRTGEGLAKLNMAVKIVDHSTNRTETLCMSNLIFKQIDKVALPEELQLELGYITRLFYPLYHLCHYLIACWNMDMGNFEEAVLHSENLEKLCNDMVSLSNERRTGTTEYCSFLYGLLGHCYLKWFMHNEAREAFKKQIQYQDRPDIRSICERKWLEIVKNNIYLF